MSEKEKIPSTDEAWESEQLGADAKQARLASQETAKQVDESLGLQMISIRLDKDLIESFKIIAAFHGIGYQPLMRDALKRFAEGEMKAIVAGMVESQRKEGSREQPPSKEGQRKEKPAKAA
ncbi:MAG: BrnA antitoxin family protein [Betaproteobacteria bacterium]|nr:BrnA antitoxin family protein [Betaproteobacteria bacterium]